MGRIRKRRKYKTMDEPKEETQGRSEKGEHRDPTSNVGS
jgi:hypothetical protein